MRLLLALLLLAASVRSAETPLRILFIGNSYTACSGAWQVSAADPPRQTILPLTNCELKEGRIRFRVKTIFLTQGTCGAWGAGGLLHGQASEETASPYQHHSGT